MTTVPRLVLGAASSSTGKTTLAVGLMRALRDRGLRVAPFKTGPDYIDPGYHGLATGHPGRNLDAHLCGPELIAPLLLHGSRTPGQADIAVIEGAMGLFDGRLGVPPVGRAAFGSSAHIAKLTHSPVLLVVDAAKSSTTVAAVAHGMASFDHDLQVAGVVLNKAGSQRNIDECTRAIEDLGIPVVGAVPRSPDLTTPSRHLGLVPAAERDQARAMVEAAGELVAAHVDLDRVLELARAAAPLEADAWDPSRLVTRVEGRPVVAVAAGRAFTFRYAETAELLRAAGCEVVEFDPLTDASLPSATAGLYLGGGFPEVFAGELSANEALREDIRRRVADGLPTVAECAGLLYLCSTLDDQPMTGALPLAATMSPKLTLGYKEPVAAADTLLTRVGERVRSHEFHRTVVPLDGLAEGLSVAWDVAGRAEGVGSASLHASYQHLHWAGFPQAAQRLAEAAAQHRVPDATSPTPEPPHPIPEQPHPIPEPVDGPTEASTSSATVAEQPATVAEQPDLTHHGDRDLVPGLTDLAVNVRSHQPPAQLAAELCSRAPNWAAYPDARSAREALAALHGLDPAMVLPTSGAAEAFTLIARALPTRCSLVVHPQFTEPEQALRLAGHLPRRHILRPQDGFVLHPDEVDGRADLVVVGNPTNPTGVLHPAAALRRLARPGRVLLVDEAFMDAVPGEPESLVAPEMTGILVTRSLTKTWSLAGIRAGYVVGDPHLVRELERLQTPWSVATPALDAMVACAREEARAQTQTIAHRIDADREHLVRALTEAGLPPVANPRAPFVLVDTSPLGPLAQTPGWVRERMTEAGFAVRRGESFPGLGPAWIRLAVRDEETSRRTAAALAGLHHTQTTTPSLTRKNT